MLIKDDGWTVTGKTTSGEQTVDIPSARVKEQLSILLQIPAGESRELELLGGSSTLKRELNISVQSELSAMPLLDIMDMVQAAKSGARTLESGMLTLKGRATLKEATVILEAESAEHISWDSPPSNIVNVTRTLISNRPGTGSGWYRWRWWYWWRHWWRWF